MIPTSNIVEQPMQKDYNNQCFHCGVRAGQKFNMQTMKAEGIFLYADARGFMICNQCADKGLLIKKKKMNKKEKKQFKAMKREMEKIRHIPHITLDRKGDIVK